MSTPPEPLRVDPSTLASHGNQLVSSAGEIPLAPPPFTTAGADAISTNIMSQVPAIEGPILAGLPEIKEQASKTAANIVAAAQQYLQTDEQLASNYERHQFDGAGTPGEAGGEGATGAAGSAANSASGQANPMSQLGQMMSMPMQMAQQAGQMPMQALGAVAQAPQSIMQGVQSMVQQVGQMTEGKGKDEGPAETDQQQPGSGQEDEQNRPKADPEGAGPGQSSGERAPEAGTVRAPESGLPTAPSEQAVPDAKSPGWSRPTEDPDRINL